MALHKNHIMVKLISWFNYIFTYCVEKSWFKVKTINNDKESLESRHKIIPKKLDLVWFSDSDTSTSYIIRYGFFLHTKFVQCFHASSYIMYYAFRYLVHLGKFVLDIQVCLSLVEIVLRHLLMKSKSYKNLMIPMNNWFGKNSTWLILFKDEINIGR